MTEDGRKARLAAALRDNLRKRKAQARGRRAADAPGERPGGAAPRAGEGRDEGGDDDGPDEPRG